MAQKPPSYELGYYRPLLPIDHHLEACIGKWLSRNLGFDILKSVMDHEDGENTFKSKLMSIFRAN
ncbi:hypothetical protein DSO06_01905 [Candidatus Nezhaarchaeota archaeon WYZ-LMO8]|nr:MAG: hypothetical protein DSO06_01905 [Candidatus Nezhaarchaeota archaeon WYZ-LMO8]TDA36445.1 MAG: hypothetical protein DSO05_03655 [Candidatus Nezhaarchaeota archaeon WYZ-LMO7]